ncbi:MAG: cytochrome c3 family protein [Candidatus Zixiibacteriota bacterium]
MSKTYLIYIFVLLMILAPAAVLCSDNNCLNCHTEMEDNDGPSHLFTRDIHYQKGLLCHDCHGGNPALEDMDDVRKSRGFRGVPNHFQVPEFCARCHSDAAYMHDKNQSLPVDQLDKYKTSQHGQLLYGKKDGKVANCVSCHTSHQIGDPRMPYSTTYPLNLPAACGACHANKDYMADYNIPTDQLDLYKQSVHGNALLEKHDLGAPACNDCHGNHGAVPPGVASLSAVCGQCHAIEADLFTNSPHFAAFTEFGYPMCETCHSKHKIVKPSDALIGWEKPAICIECHDRDSDARITGIIDSIKTSLVVLARRAESADSIITQTDERGMETTDIMFLMKDVNQALIGTRTAVHSFDINKVAQHAAVGLAKADSIQVQAAGLIDEYYFRRWGLAIATLFITILAIALYFKIRQIEGR